MSIHIISSHLPKTGKIKDGERLIYIMQCYKTKIMEKEKQLFIIFSASYVDVENLN